MSTALLTRPVFWIALVVAIAAAALLMQITRPRAQAGALSNVSVTDLRAAAQAGAVVIDVREEHEYRSGHVAGSILVPLATVGARAGEFDENEPIYVFCRSGNRSLQAANALVAAGFTDVRNVEGGILAWNAARLPVVQ